MPAGNRSDVLAAGRRRTGACAHGVWTGRLHERGSGVDVKKAESAALGLCTRCHKRPAEPGKKNCAVCLDGMRTLMEHRYAERVSLGLCIQCYTPALPGHIVCARHLDRRREVSRSQREAHREENRVYNRERYRKIRAEGRCTLCGAPAYGCLCTVCAEKRNEHARRLYAAKGKDGKSDMQSVKAAAGDCI